MVYLSDQHANEGTHQAGDHDRPACQPDEKRGESDYFANGVFSIKEELHGQEGERSGLLRPSAFRAIDLTPYPGVR
ncbi:hypothetical protein QN239_20370 [Mycolicibacterium sp. Y3]